MADTIARARLVLEGNEPPSWPVPISKQLLRDLIALAEGHIPSGYAVVPKYSTNAPVASIDVGVVL
jgi:hypothetical protein